MRANPNAVSSAAGTVATPSGLAALSIGLMAAVSAGDHLLVSDSAYRPTRIFCDSDSWVGAKGYDRVPKFLGYTCLSLDTVSAKGMSHAEGL